MVSGLIMRPDDKELYQLASTVGALLHQRHWVLVTAESCTGGWVGQAITAVPGSSAWYEAGFITYSNSAKISQLGVKSTSLEKYGAVSEEVVQEMAQGALQCGPAHLSLAISGIAGPNGGSIDKPVGTVCLAWISVDGDAIQTTCHFAGDREEVRACSVAAALRGVLEILS